MASLTTLKILATAILCTVYIERKFSVMFLIVLMCDRIPPSPDNFKRYIKYQFFQTLFYSGFESVANTVFSFQTNFGRDPFNVIRM